MDKDTYNAICEGLTKLLEEDKVYLLNDLRLDNLALRLNSNKAYVSAVINKQYQVNFHTLINRCRINKAIELLDKGGVQIKTVWQKSGFNSQSAFNIAFKKEKGMTPSEWLVSD
jgi:YesN/AraC family two-component response regulator